MRLLSVSEVIFMRRTLTGLRPTDALGGEALERVPLNEDVRVEITRPRRLGHHRKFFALLNAVFPHQTTYGSLNLFRAAIEVSLGFGESVKLPGGRTIIIPKSIGFSSMDQTEFDTLFDKAVELIVTRIIPGLDSDDLRKEVDDIILGNR